MQSHNGYWGSKVMKEFYCKVNETPGKIPDTTQAERWLTEDTFEFEGTVYRVLPNGKVVEVRECSQKK